MFPNKTVINYKFYDCRIKHEQTNLYEENMIELCHGRVLIIFQLIVNLLVNSEQLS